MSAPPLSPISPQTNLPNGELISQTVTPLLPPTILQPPPTHKLRILLLSSDTGGGHRASAQALRAALLRLDPKNLHVDIVDFWVDLACGPFTRFPSQYTFLAKHPLLWKLSYEITRFPPARFATEATFNALAHRKVRESFQKYAPDLIVSVHPLVNTLSLHVLRQLRVQNELPTPPYVTVVTDLGGAHPTWFHKDVDMTYIPSEGVRAVAKKMHIPAVKLRRLGLPVREQFWTPPPADKSALRQQLGLIANRPVVLAIGGGDGVGGLRAIAETLANELGRRIGEDGVQLVVVCGKNDSLRASIAASEWPIKVTALGYVSNMSDWMVASDIVCTKAGPGTIAEALIRGLPIVITGYLPGQEEANVKYVVSEQVGQFAKKPVKIAELVARWLANPQLLADMSCRALAIARPHASLEIAADLMEVAKVKITENIQSWERQQVARASARRDLVDGRAGPLLGDSSPESHLVFRIRFLLRVVFGSMLVQKAFNFDNRSSRSPPSSPVDTPSRTSADSSNI